MELRPAGLRFEAQPGETLLAAAERAGLALPSSCRNGTCRTCIAQVARGRTRCLIEWPGLSAEEKAQGYVLPCVSCADSDLALTLAAR